MARCGAPEFMRLMERMGVQGQPGLPKKTCLRSEKGGYPVARARMTWEYGAMPDLVVWGSVGLVCMCVCVCMLYVYVHGGSCM